MMEMRPIVLDDDNVILGGNMRFKACTDLKWSDIPYIRFTKKDWETNEKDLKKEDRKSYEDRCREFVIKDNSGFGEWDWDLLANSWDSTELNFWGVDVWKNIDDMFDTLEVEEENEEKLPTAYDDDYSKFDLIMLHENRGKLISTLNDIKEQNNFETLEQALMHLIDNYNEREQ